MKTLVQSFVFLLACMTIFSCQIQRPISKTAASNNQTYKVEYLFEQDGCKVYRFLDLGHYVYFTTCSNQVTSFESDSVKIRTINTITNKPSR